MASVKGKKRQKHVKQSAKPEQNRQTHPGVGGSLLNLAVAVGEAVLSCLPEILAISPFGSVMTRWNADRRYDFWKDEMGVWTWRFGRWEIEAFPKDVCHTFELKWGKLSFTFDLR